MSNEASDSAYKYEDLEGRDAIRLISLGHPSKPYMLCTFMIEESPAYHALSYCWGKPDRSETISCNGGVLEVTSTLEVALKELQAIPQLRTWFWIDQISVNQEDLLERSHQVQLMPKIFSRAIRTVIWLGPRPSKHAPGSVDQTGDDDLFGLAEHVFRIGQDNEELSYLPRNSHRGDRRRQVPDWNGAIPRVRSIQTVDDLVILGLPNIHDHRWKRLCDFFEQPWFSRIWVVQEVTLSLDVPVIVHHGQLRSFLHILWAGAFIAQNITIFSRMSIVNARRNRSKVTEHGRLLLQLSFAKSQWLMESLIWLTFRFGATDQRDKYYALLSLAGELQMTTSTIPKALVPDYRKCLGEVARDFTRYFIETSKSLLLFSLLNPSVSELERRSEDNTPSWAYIPSNKLSNLRFGEQYILSGWPYAIKRKAHNVASDLSIKIGSSENSNVLILGGVRRDELVDVPAGRSGRFRLLEWCQQGHKRLNQVGTTSVEVYLARFFATISARHDFEGRDVRPSIEDLRSWLARSEEAEFSPLEYLKNLIPKPIHSDFEDPGNSQIVDRWISMYEEDGDFQYRQFGVTKEGLLVIGPQAMQPGDFICVLHGGELPYVLRPVRDKYHLLGECYIHGLDVGQERLYWRKLRLERFCLE